MKTPYELTVKYFNATPEEAGIEIFTQHEAYVESTQQDALKSLSAKLPDEEVQHIAEKHFSDNLDQAACQDAIPLCPFLSPWWGCGVNGG